MRTFEQCICFDRRPTPREYPPARSDDITERYYQRYVTGYAAELGVAERDLTYTVAYRAALTSWTTERSA